MAKAPSFHTQIESFLFLVAPPKVAKASIVLCHCRWHYHTYFANGNTALQARYVYLPADLLMKYDAAQRIAKNIPSGGEEEEYYYEYDYGTEEGARQGKTDGKGSKDGSDRAQFYKTFYGPNLLMFEKARVFVPDSLLQPSLMFASASVKHDSGAPL